ncbi:D-inositol-3-phosphate glycosyltransferase [anaerobic digester metagenome]|nr:glycosyltransferase [Lentimicrobiaceae bacterium]
MKILQISSTLNTGAPGRIAEEIGLYLKSLGHSSYVAYADIGRNGSSSNAIKVGNKADFYAHVLLTRIFDRHAYGSGFPTRKLINQIRSINPDVIHIHNVHGYYLHMRILFDYLKQAQKPVVYTLHDCWSFTGHCSYFDIVGCEKWKTGCYECPNKKAYPASWLIDRSKKNYVEKKVIFNGVKNLTLVTPSKWLAGLVSQSFLSNYSVEVINNGVNTEVFKPMGSAHVREKYGVGDRRLILGVAYQWSPRKGLNDFITLSKLLGEDYQIILVGLDDKQQHKLPANIRGIKRTENVKVLAEIYAAADVFVNPTWQDNFPTTNLEAMASGTPVVTYNTGGSPEALDSQTGFVVDKGDVNGLKTAIEHIFETKVESFEMPCRQRALNLFKTEHSSAKYLKLYEEKITDYLL